MATSEERKAYRRAYYLANKEKALAAAKKWREENAEKNKAHHQIYHKQWYAKNRDRIIEQSKQWHAINRERSRGTIAAWRKRNPERLKGFRLKNLYGITWEQYHEMFESQEGRCAICGTAEKKLGVDHCHVSGTVRGLLCQPCNIGIGVLNDSLANLRAAIAYLEIYEAAEARPLSDRGGQAEAISPSGTAPSMAE